MIGIVKLNQPCVFSASTFASFAQRDPVVFPQLEAPCLEKVLQIPVDRPAALIGCIGSGRRHPLSGWYQSKGTGYLNRHKTRRVPHVRASSFASKMRFITSMSLSLYSGAWQLMRHTLYHPWKPWHRRPLVCIPKAVNCYSTIFELTLIFGVVQSSDLLLIVSECFVWQLPSLVILGSNCSGTRWAWFVKKTGSKWMRGRPKACCPSSKWRPTRTWGRWILG